MKNVIKRELIALNLKGFDTPGLVSFQRAIVKGLTVRRQIRILRLPTLQNCQ